MRVATAMISYVAVELGTGINSIAEPAVSSLFFYRGRLTHRLTKRQGAAAEVLNATGIKINFHGLHCDRNDVEGYIRPRGVTLPTVLMDNF